MLERRTGEHQSAVSAWNEIREVEPRDNEAFDALERLYLASGETDTLVSLLLSRVTNAESDDEAMRFLFRTCGAL